jgi:hypothetical protein
MANGQTFYEVITAAINDLAIHGFDSAERLAYWQEEIRVAAERDLTPTYKMEEQLREAMSAVFTKLVDKEGILKSHPGVPRFTIQRLKPQLHDELRRRILMSADLIRLNRRQSIDKTVQRFSGWASSIPKGGSKNVDKKEEKETIRKALSSLPFEERRVLIDQGHKLAASISHTIASDGGAIAVRWRSKWRQAGYNYREDHKERDNHVYLLKESWAKRAGLVKVNEDGYYENITAVAEEPFCRCFAVWIYSLRDLPDDMLTKKGVAELKRVRALINAS